MFYYFNRIVNRFVYDKKDWNYTEEDYINIID